MEEKKPLSNITRVDIANMLSLEFKIPNSEAQRMTKKMLEYIAENLQKGTSVRLNNICILSSKEKEEHTKIGFNKEYKVDKKRVLYCKQSSRLFDNKGKKEENNFLKQLEKKLSEY